MFTSRLLRLGLCLYDPNDGGGDGDRTPAKEKTDHNGPGDGYISKDKVDEIVRERLARASRSNDKKIEEARQSAIQSYREELGLDDEMIKALPELRAKRSGESKEMSELRVKMSSQEKTLAKLQEQNQGYLKQLTSGAISRAVDDALLKGNVSPESVEDVRRLLSMELAVDDDFNVVPRDEASRGKKLSDFTQNWLNKRPYYLKPDAGGGAGTKPPRGSGKGAGDDRPDLSTRGGMSQAFTNAIRPKGK